LAKLKLRHFYFSALEVSRNIRLLESQKTAYIKKRQLMRILFGDYRKKMENEEKKFKLSMIL